ncbi:predicted protein, partial [Nematostella vectensis]
NVIEVYPLASIGTVQHISDDTDLNSVLLFSTLQTDDKYAATHLFQSDRVPAAVVATEIMKASSSKEDRERMDLHERSLVAQTIAAFSVHSQSNIKKPSRVPRSSSQGDGEQEDSNSLEALEARTNRDVGDDSGPTSPTVLAAAAKFRRLASIKNENDKETTPSSTPGKRGIFRRTTVLYDFQARNSRELSVKQNEELVVLDDSRQWWCVRNSEGAIGFIPNTVVQANNEQGLSQKDKGTTL